jgi:hypothetical protein
MIINTRNTVKIRIIEKRSLKRLSNMTLSRGLLEIYQRMRIKLRKY